MYFKSELISNIFAGNLDLVLRKQKHLNADALTGYLGQDQITSINYREMEIDYGFLNIN